MKGYFSSFFKNFAKSFYIFFLFSTVYFACGEKEMCTHVEILSWFPPWVVYVVQTLKHKVSAGLCLYSFRISHHWKHLPHCPDWLFYCAFTSLCWVTSNSSHALFLETAQAYSMSHFPTLLSAMLDVCCPGFVHPDFVQSFNPKSQEKLQNVKLASKNSSQHAPEPI